MRYAIAALTLALFACGCGTADCIHASQIDATVRRIADRHDSLVNASAMPDLDKRVALRDTALLRTVLDAAERAPETQPTK